jgi:hypothetical protein
MVRRPVASGVRPRAAEEVQGHCSTPMAVVD